MLVCVDTNVMLHAFARGSDMVSLFKAIGTGRISIAVSTSILLEYEEIAAQQGGAPFAARIMALSGAGYKPQPITPQDFITRFLSAGG